MSTRDSSPLKVGLIGLDTSHAVAFADNLNVPEAKHHVPGARIVSGYPGGSPDFPLSASRVEGFTRTLADKHGVAIVDTPEQAAENCDALMLTAADGRVHLPLFQRVAGLGKPVFIDKPFALSGEEAQAIADLAMEKRTPVFSASSLRFIMEYRQLIQESPSADLRGADLAGPMPIEETQGRFFWYGIHTAEALYAAMGPGCRRVRAETSGDADLILGEWSDGRMGVIRGFRGGEGYFQAVVHYTDGCRTLSLLAGARPLYHGLLQQVIRFFQTGASPVPVEESIEVIRFLECAGESAGHGGWVEL